MFGTLSTQSKEPLTFVENPDVATVLSRNRRDKPHVSCELCRTRKTRCSGEPSGCDKCVAIAAECRYPSRDTRRKKRGHSSFQHEDATSSRTGSSKQDTSGNDLESTVMEGESNHQRNDNAASSGPSLQTGSDMGILGGETDQHVEQQHIEQWLSSNPIRNDHSASDDRGVPEDCSIDEWPGLASLLGPELNIPFEVNSGDVDERPGSGFFEHAVYPSDEDDGYGYGSRSVRHSKTAVPMESVMASLSTALASPRPSGPSSTRSIDSTKDHQGGQDVPRYGSGRRGPPALTQMSYNGSRRAEDRRKLQVSMTSTPRRRGSGRDFSASGVQISPREACRCLSSAVCLLEELGARSTSKNPASMDILLSLLRHGLARCKEILTCQRCHGQGEEGVLVGLACQYMATMYERVVKGCVTMLEDMMNQRQHPPRHSSSSSSPPESAGWRTAWSDENESAQASNDRRSDTTDDMWFSTYRIESSCERMHVLTTLVTIQITEFAQLLGTLRGRATGRPRRMMIIIETEKTTNLTRRLLRTTIDRAIATKETDVDM